MRKLKVKRPDNAKRNKSMGLKLNPDDVMHLWYYFESFNFCDFLYRYGRLEQKGHKLLIDEQVAEYINQDLLTQSVQNKRKTPKKIGRDVVTHIRLEHYSSDPKARIALAHKKRFRR
jgi:hypothetical protein